MVEIPRLKARRRPPCCSPHVHGRESGGAVEAVARTRLDAHLERALDSRSVVTRFGSESTPRRPARQVLWDALVDPKDWQQLAQRSNVTMSSLSTTQSEGIDVHGLHAGPLCSADVVPFTLADKDRAIGSNTEERERMTKDARIRFREADDGGIDDRSDGGRWPRTSLADGEFRQRLFHRSVGITDDGDGITGIDKCP